MKGSGESPSSSGPCETSSAVSLQVVRNDGTASSRPNFLLILTDDHGYGDVAFYQEHSQRRTGTLVPIDIDTPNIDQIAKEGIVYWNMRANATVCSPTRAALLTGKYPDRVGVPGVIRTHANDSWGHLTPNTKTLPDYLAQSNPKKLLELTEALRRNIQRGGMTPWQLTSPATNESGSSR